MLVRVAIGLSGFVAALGASAAGCASDPEEPEPTVAEIIEQEIGETVLEDCGTIETGIDNCNIEAPPPDIAARLECITDAWASCRAARLSFQSSSIEGVTSPKTWLVLPADGSCELVRYTDWTLDPFGGCKLLRSECAPFDDTYVPGCPWLYPSTCTDDDTALENPDCM